MKIHIKELSDELFLTTVQMITELMNYHRKLNKAPKEYWQTDEQSKGTLRYWKEKGTVYNIFLDNEPVILLCCKKICLKNFVPFYDVIPRNTSAIKFFKECGFDHLNLIQLRKNYDKKLDKNDEIELLGFNFKKY